jgi:hypothetical protein
MALTLGDVTMWEALTALGVIPPNPRLLEIGQANWYGDVPVPEGCESPTGCRFEVARKWYDKLFAPRRVVSIDFQGKDSLPYDLNEPLPMDERHLFDVIVNTGTAEHVFDQRQLMQTIHERCDVNGLMLHAVPWKGWEDHGFYCYQPCFFADLARANHYEVIHDVTWTCGTRTADSPEVTENVMLYVAMRQTRREPFRVPLQGRLGLGATAQALPPLPARQPVPAGV